MSSLLNDKDEPAAPTKKACAPAGAIDERPIVGAAADEELALLAKAVGHPLRVQILRILEQRETCVCGDLVDVLPVAQSTVSQHLKVLKDAGLIRGEIDGPRVCYCIDPRVLRRFKVLIAGL
jgi:ArsR family transcriptional regulator